MFLCGFNVIEHFVLPVYQPVTFLDRLSQKNGIELCRVGFVAIF